MYVSRLKKRVTYHLQLRDVLFPPEVLLVFWPRARDEVVGIHDDVDEGVYGT